MVDTQPDITEAAQQIVEHAENALRNNPNEELRDRLEQILEIASRISKISKTQSGGAK